MSETFYGASKVSELRLSAGILCTQGCGRVTRVVDDAGPGQNAERAQRRLDRRDVVLSMLVDLAEKGIELPVTLFIGGAVVSGILVSGRVFFDGIGSQLETIGTGVDTEIRSVIADALRTSGWAYDAPAEHSPFTGEQLALYRELYLHLKGARALSGSALVPTSGEFWWRGRLSSVDAFSLGTLHSN